MSLKHISAAALLAVASASSALADGLAPGSVLVYPFFRSDVSQANTWFTVIAVTNTNLTPITPQNLLGGSTNLHYEFANAITNPDKPGVTTSCFVTDLIPFATPADLTVDLVSCINGGNMSEGYLVVTATDPNTFSTPWSHNYLIGSELVINGNGGLWYLNAIPFVSPVDEGAPTDLDGDGQLDFDGLEYEGIPDELYIDSFVATLNASLTLANFSGGNAFTANIHFDIFNDNEQPLSATYAFVCWVEQALEDYSEVFSESYLANNTLNDPTELDLDCDGVGELETGWARIRGINHSSSAETGPDAALLGAIGQSKVFNIGGRRLWESKAKQLDGDFFKTGANDLELNPPAPPVVQ